MLLLTGKHPRKENGAWRTGRTMKIGIIGVGIVGSAVATGLCSAKIEGLTLFLSARTEKKARAVHESFPDCTQIIYDNQEIVDRSDWVILAVMPGQAEQLLAGLNFHKGQKLISLIPTLSLAHAGRLTGLDEVYDVLPMPFCAKHIGPVAMYPPCGEVGEVIGRLGTLVVAETPDEMAAFRSVTCLMSAHYQLLAKTAEVCVNAGADSENAELYIASLFEALAAQARLRPESLQELAQEMTPGGLNYYVWSNLDKAGMYEEWKELNSHIVKKVKKD